MDSLIETGASMVVLWELAGTEEHRQGTGAAARSHSWLSTCWFSRPSFLWSAITPASRCLA